MEQVGQSLSNVVHLVALWCRDLANGGAWHAAQKSEWLRKTIQDFQIEKFDRQCSLKRVRMGNKVGIDTHVVDPLESRLGRNSGLQEG